ncbi:MAG: K(+)/H(+) antiporter NhaP [Acidobacteria bacterium]|nr:K(+)/H(+) antiporter NhaP [Acidobacteriota bacterium]
MPIEHILLGVATMLLLSIIASKASARLGVPVLLAFLAIGMLAGSDGPGGIHFDNARLAQSLGVVALALILFAGGLDTNREKIRPVWRQGILLATIGVLLTAGLMACLAKWALGFSWREGFLLGAIVSSTDAAAVFAELRSRSVRLRGHLEPLLELESGSNDPMAVFLTLGMISLLMEPSASFAGLIPMFFFQMGLGAALGLAIGKGLTFIINRLRLEYEGLYPALTLSGALLTYGLTASVGGNGFLAAYLAGIILGNSDFIHKRSLIRFHDGLAWLMQLAMFLTLGLLVFPTRLVPIIGAGLLASAFLIFVARPVSVFASLLPAKLGVREKTMLSWVGLRGAAPIIMATFPLVAGIPKAEIYFNLVFFIVLTSSLLQGTTISLMARWLGVEAPPSPRQQSLLEYEPPVATSNDLIEIIVPANSAAGWRRVMDLGLPEGALIVLQVKGDETIVPGGGTIIEANDRLLIFARKDDRDRIRALFSVTAPSG